ncbi:MAG TPA: hypothetical protein VF701_09405 [Thermoanaerobaculia bacterium]
MKERLNALETSPARQSRRQLRASRNILASLDRSRTPTDSPHAEATTARLHRLGHDVLGPVFASFARLLLRAAERDGVTRLGFVARDGEFLQIVVQRLVDRLAIPSPPHLDYIHLSRISTILSGYRTFSEAVEGEAEGFFGARTSDTEAFLRYFGLEPSRFTFLLENHGLTTRTPVPSAADVRPLLDDAIFRDCVAAEAAAQKEMLRRYLEQKTALLHDARFALVDLGWRASIQIALARGFVDCLPNGRLRGYYFGYWDDRRAALPPSCEVSGVITDIRRRRTPVEGSAFYAAYILESICRAPHGTVLGYESDGTGQVVPSLAGESPQRSVEVLGERSREPIRRGILQYIDGEAERYRHADDDFVRANAQKKLFRLAFFPTRSEIDAVNELAHTEGHAPQWSRTLIDARRPSPFLSPRRWIAGLASPWRSGYIKATGGTLLALAFTLTELVFLAFPSVRRTMRVVALRFARWV